MNVKLWQQKAADTEKGQLNKMSTEFYERQTRNSLQKCI